MKNYSLKLKGTKKQGTSDLRIEIKADNKQQAYSWAYYFFEKGEFREPFQAKDGWSEGTIEFIPQAKEMMHLAGKYKVPKSALICL